MNLNQFPVSAPSGNMSVMAQTDQNRAVAEVQASLMIARMNPRDERSAMDRILNSCTRQSLAQNAIYQYARGGTDISGASIRLAEAIAQQWGNIQFGIRELEQRNGGSTVQAFAWDVETNTRREVTFFVPHERYSRNGSKKLTDPRDIYEMVANQGARRLRACILAIIPSDVTEAAVIQCEKTLISTADVTPEAIKRLVEAFDEMGVSKEQIEIRIQRRLDAVQPAQIANLRKIYASIRDGMSTPEEWFEAVQNKITTPKSEKVETEVKQTRKSKSSVDSLVGGAAETTIESVAATPTPTPDQVQAPVAPPVVQEPIESGYSDMPTDLPPIEGTIPVGELRPESAGTMPIPELEPEPVKNGLVTPPEHKKWIEQIDAWETLTDIANTMRDMPAKIKEDLKEYTADKNAQVKRKIDIGNWVKEISNCNSRADLTKLQNRMPESIRNDGTIQYNLSVREDYGINNHPDLW